MVRQHLVEVGEDLARRILLAVARQPAAIGLDHAQRRRIELIGVLEALAGFLLVAGEIEDQAGMQVLEDRVPVRPGELVDRRHRGLGVAGAIQRPGREQRRGQIGDRAAHRLRQSAARGAVLLVLERVHAEHQLGDAVALVGLRDAFGEFHRLRRRRRRPAATGRRGRAARRSSGRASAPRGNRRRRRRASRCWPAWRAAR